MRSVTARIDYGNDAVASLLRAMTTEPDPTARQHLAEARRAMCGYLAAVALLQYVDELDDDQPTPIMSGARS